MAGPRALAGMPPETAGQLAARLSRATRREIAQTGATRTLLEMAGWPAAREMPVAALTRQVDVGDTGNGYWLRADPAYMEVGTNLVLRQWRDLGISEAERQVLEPDLAAAFADAGMQFSAPVPERWYLSSDDSPELATTPPDEVGIRDAAGCLPEGEDATFWQRLMSEIQIVLNNHPVNKRRRREGRLPVNSVWFWGGGRLPEQISPRFSTVRGAGALGRSLQAFSAGGTAASDVFFLDGLDAEAWRELGESMDSARRIRVLLPDAGQAYEWRPMHRLRFWRKVHGLPDWLGMPW